MHIYTILIQFIVFFCSQLIMSFPAFEKLCTRQTILSVPSWFNWLCMTVCVFVILFIVYSSCPALAGFFSGRIWEGLPGLCWRLRVFFPIWCWHPSYRWNAYILEYGRQHRWNKKEINSTADDLLYFCSIPQCTCDITLWGCEHHSHKYHRLSALPPGQRVARGNHSLLVEPPTNKAFYQDKYWSGGLSLYFSLFEILFSLWWLVHSHLLKALKTDL